MNEECDKGYLYASQNASATHAIYFVASLQKCYFSGPFLLAKSFQHEASSTILLPSFANVQTEQTYDVTESFTIEVICLIVF